jgi:hypothetical protein
MLALGALFVEERLGLIDEETVKQIRENKYNHLFIGFAVYFNSAPFDSSIMVCLQRHFS